jgi:enterochelin esterase-like enzyme
MHEASREGSGVKRSGTILTTLSVLSILVYVLPAQPQTPTLSLQHNSTVAKVGKGSPQFRAITGVSMGGYGAMNIGLSHPDQFKTMACLGGLLDMAYLLKYIEVDMMGNYDNLPSYPNRDTRINMLKDLSISFGNPVYYNPLSTYYPPGITSENATTPTTLFNFFDGKVNLDGSLPVISYGDPGPDDWVEVLLAVDLNGNGKRDPGEPIPTGFHELFTDLNGNGMYDPGEPFLDDGLDSGPGIGDFGEGDGKFSYNPHRENFLAEDPLTHLENLPLETLKGLNLYLDAGTEDEFQFNIHTEHFVKTLHDRGLNVQIEDGFPESFPLVSHFDEKRVYVSYEGGHVGFDKENIGLSFKKAKKSIEGAILVANRFTTLFAFVSDHFPDGDYGTDPIEMIFHPSKMLVASFYSPSLKRKMKYGLYLPPGYKSRKTTYYPVLYLLGGYNMGISSIANSQMRSVFDALILTQEMQKMIIVIPDGMNYKNKRGHFFVNQIDKERGDNFMDYFFDIVKFIDDHFQTK